MTTDTPTLAEWMEGLAQVSVKMTEKEEQAAATLFMLTKKQEMVVAMLAVGSGSEVAQAARILIYKEEPVMAALQTEGWTVHWDLARNDPDRLAAERGEIRPSQLPRYKRGEM